MNSYYVSNGGSDSNPGTKSQPWKTPRVVSNAVVNLAAGEVFTLTSQLIFSSTINATITTDTSNPATLLGPSSGNITAWENSVNPTLQNVIVDSIGGTGFVGNVRGTNISIINVLLKDLSEGFDYVGCNGLNIIGGHQIGKVAGRCHYLIDVTNINWQGDINHAFGPASAQSPVRFSSPGVVGGNIENVNVTQVNSPFPIATWAIHAAKHVNFKNCIANGGEFSFDAAGAGSGDNVSNCIITSLHTINTKLNIKAVAFNNQFIDVIGINPTGECIAISALPKSGNSITGAKLTAPNHGIHFYTANDTLVKDTTLYSKKGVVMDGATSSSNNGGGNVVVDPSVTPKQLSGTVIGTSGSWGNHGNTIANVFDGNLNSFFDAPNADGAWVGLALKAPSVISKIEYAPRNGWSGYQQRMVSGTFQGANKSDFSDAVSLGSVSVVPAPNVLTAFTVTHTQAFSYVRYLSPVGSYGNIAEMVIFGK